MHLRLPISFAIFIGSYLPLSLILLAQDFDYGMLGRPLCWTILDPMSACDIPLKNPAYSLGILGACVLCLGATLLTLANARPKLPIDVVSTAYVPAELMSYTLPYVVSFMALDYAETGKFVGLLIFLAWMFWITHKSGQIILNPVLVAFGWRLYDLTYRFPGDNVERQAKALVRGLPEPGDRFLHTTLQDVLLAKREGT